RADVWRGPVVSRYKLAQAIEGARYVVPARTVELSVEGMSCASCVGRVEAALRKVEGVQEVVVNLATERATIHGQADAAALVAAVDSAGYDARPLEPTTSAVEEEVSARKDAERTELKRDCTLAMLPALP